MHTPPAPVRKINAAHTKTAFQLKKNGATNASAWTRTIQTTTGQSRPRVTNSDAPAPSDISQCAASKARLLPSWLTGAFGSCGTGNFDNSRLALFLTRVNKATDSWSFICLVSK